jgi:hypothetical protein
MMSNDPRCNPEGEQRMHLYIGIPGCSNVSLIDNVDVLPSCIQRNKPRIRQVAVLYFTVKKDDARDSIQG